MLWAFNFLLCLRPRVFSLFVIPTSFFSVFLCFYLSILQFCTEHKYEPIHVTTPFTLSIHFLQCFQHLVIIFPVFPTKIVSKFFQIIFLPTPRWACIFAVSQYWIKIQTTTRFFKLTKHETNRFDLFFSSEIYMKLSWKRKTNFFLWKKSFHLMIKLIFN